MISSNDQACLVEIAEDRPRLFLRIYTPRFRLIPQTRNKKMLADIYSHLDVTLIVNKTYIYKHTNSFFREMFLDSRPLSSDAISDEEDVGGSEDVAVFKEDPDDDNDADDDEDDEKDGNEADDDDSESNDAVAMGVVMVITDKDGDEDDNSGVDCSSGVSVGGVRCYR